MRQVRTASSALRRVRKLRPKFRGSARGSFREKWVTSRTYELEELTTVETKGSELVGANLRDTGVTSRVILLPWAKERNDRHLFQWVLQLFVHRVGRSARFSPDERHCGFSSTTITLLSFLWTFLQRDTLLSLNARFNSTFLRWCKKNILTTMSLSSLESFKVIFN